ncbi:alanine acetyltransferase [Corynebacterium pseudotuberculosis]|uniref:GNAT family N-acetyltransferase n=1 Tax=Corynebacterium pseudotuberculosis TaxID=1719 RepID=UPI000737C938|nr:GNAT family N-acetyltransferase [Corynebacterium pseudotuberculosis]ALU22018.1 alanine acetyltransferase [Corynebacterium pseudotuberculosis]ANH24350.1 Ribosomal-protein-alanine acetyltransferase [Corynebacterium pseudotuberculosis]
MTAHVPTLSNDSVKLRPLLLSDAHALTATCRDPLTQKYTTVPANYTFAMAEEFIKTEHDNLRWVITVPTSDRFCGQIELRSLATEHNAMNVGYMTAPWARGQGLMTSALLLAVDYAFSRSVRRIELQADSQNKASQRVAEKAGFILIDSSQDTMVYSLLADEYHS